MLILTVNHDFHYETENLVRVFYPHEKITVLKNPFSEENVSACDNKISALIVRTGCYQKYSVAIDINGKHQTAEDVGDIDSGRNAELLICSLLFDALVGFTGYKPCWGMLTGVRPAKLMGKLRAEYGDEQARQYFTDVLKVSPEKTSLALAVSEKQDEIIALNHNNCFSLYISVPFCPSRCSYCSFVSHSIEKAKKLLPDYTQLLCEEIKATAEIAAELGLHLKSVYMGGGTPTTLSAEQLDKVLSAVNECFDMSECLEFTVEAGRPDTVTKEKLEALKKNGVGRISINPQTFNDNILLNIGRRHTVKQTVDAYNTAVEAGFNNINTDLIAGLPDDTVESFKNSVDRAISLAPSNITVHTLALKRSSSIVTEKEYIINADVSAMLDYAAERLTENGYSPYYMYRQSKCVGNLENVGWAKKGCECLYNVFMMEEIHTVLACGGGAVTKLKEDGVNNIDRIFNFKYPYEYIDRFTEILSRKDKIYDFYEQYGKND